MAIALIGSIPALKQSGALAKFGRAVLALRAGFTAARQRYEERRMLIAVQAIDHPGVFADAKTACDSASRRR